MRWTRPVWRGASGESGRIEPHILVVHAPTHGPDRMGRKLRPEVLKGVDRSVAENQRVEIPVHQERDDGLIVTMPAIRGLDMSLGHSDFETPGDHAGGGGSARKSEDVCGKRGLPDAEPRINAAAFAGLEGGFNLE